MNNLTRSKFLMINAIIFSIFAPSLAFSLEKEFSLEFGIVKMRNKNGQTHYEIGNETRTIPFCPIRKGYEIVIYGLIMEEKTKKPFTAKLVHHYPGLSVSWLPFDDPKGEKVRRTVSQFPSENAFSGWWAMMETMHEGDTIGKHRLEVQIDGKLYKEIEFETVKSDDCPKRP